MCKITTTKYIIALIILHPYQQICNHFFVFNIYVPEHVISSDRPIPEFAMVCMRKIKAQNETDSDDDDLSDDDTREEAPFRIEKLHTRGISSK